MKWELCTSPFFLLTMRHCIFQLCPGRVGKPWRRPFHFEATWLSHLAFKELVLALWDSGLSMPASLNILRARLKIWNREVFHVQTRKPKLLGEIQSVQNLIAIAQSDSVIGKEESLMQELDTILEQEETLWFQKSREKWIAQDGRSTIFFHTSNIICRRCNRIETLRGVDDHWIWDPMQLEGMAVHYLTRLYSMEDVPVDVDCLPQEGFAKLSRSDLGNMGSFKAPVHGGGALRLLFTGEEVKLTVCNMGSFKALSLDGYQPVFYQRCWDVVGESVIRFVLDFFARELTS
ncbi:hypothetical protein V2J09_012857 [Rumex salicifolius]